MECPDTGSSRLLFGNSLNNFFEEILELGHLFKPSFLLHHLPTFLDNQLLGGDLEAITVMHVGHHQQVQGILHRKASQQTLDTSSFQSWEVVPE